MVSPTDPGPLTLASRERDRGRGGGGALLAKASAGRGGLPMRYRPFGRTGLSVSVVGFGCWPMAGDRYGAIDDSEAIQAIHRALDRGINCVDTAPAYGAGHSEEVVARALETRRRDVILV